MTTLHQAIAVGVRGTPREFPEVPDLPGLAPPDPIPLDQLPPVLGDMARTISAAAQAPLDAAIGAVIGAVAVAVVGRVHVEISLRRDWVKPAHEYVGIVLPSGTGKSPLLKWTGRAVREWEKERATMEALPRRLAAERLALAHAQLEKARKNATKDGDSATLESHVEAVMRAERTPHDPFQLLIQDATEEAAVRALAANDGRAAVIDPEGTILEIAGGRYGNGDARLALLTHGWDGEPMRVDRITRTQIDIPSANLALLIAIQPGIIEGLANAETMRKRGVFARFLWFAPHVDWDRIKTGAEVPDLDVVAVRRFERVIRALLDSTADHAHTLCMSPEAQRGIDTLERLGVGGMRPGGALESVEAFAGKFPDHGARLAALFTLAYRAGEEEDLFDAIPAWAVQSATHVLKAIASHVVHVTGSVGAQRDLWYLLHRIQALHTNGPVTSASLLKGVQGRKSIPDAQELKRLLDELEERGCIRLVEQAPTGGRPRKPIIELHPQLQGTAV